MDGWVVVVDFGGYIYTEPPFPIHPPTHTHKQKENTHTHTHEPTTPNSFAGRTDKRGHELYCWAEDGSWVLGREVRVPKERSTCTCPLLIITLVCVYICMCKEVCVSMCTPTRRTHSPQHPPAFPPTHTFPSNRRAHPLPPLLPWARPPPRLFLPLRLAPRLPRHAGRAPFPPFLVFSV